MKRVLTILFGVLLPLFPVAAEPLDNVRFLTEADGLSSNHVWCCHQDSRGFIWIGTANGLDCYDGMQFRTFPHATRCLSESDGILWAGTDTGIYSFSLSDGRFSHFTHVTQYGVNIISRVNDIAVCDGTIVWAGTEGQGLFLYNTLSQELIQHSIHTPYIESIRPQTDGRVIITDRDGKSHLYSAKGDYLFPLDKVLPDRDPSLTDREGTRWIPTESQGIMMIPDQDTGLETYPLPEGTTAAPPMVEDEQGDIIVGVNDRLYSFSKKDRQYKLLGRISPHGNITRLLNAPEGIWIGTDTDCICLYSPRSQQTRHYHTGGKTNILYRTRQGEFMAGTSLGVFTWDSQIDKLHRDLNRRDIRILIDGKQPEDTSYPKEFEVVSQSSVVAMCEDASGNYLYLATSNRGVFRKDLITKGWEHLLTSESRVPWNKITVLWRCSDGTVLAGTDGEGLWMMNPDNLLFAPLSPSDPRLQNSRIVGVTEDREGMLWLCASSGLWRMNPKTGNSEMFPIRAESILLSSGGDLFLGNQNGIVFLQPRAKMLSSRRPSTIVIREISVQDSTFFVPAGGRDITLTYPQNSFSISMAALSFAESSQNLYSWCLSGIDSGWTPPGSIPTATYKSVQPGEYVFRVMGSDDSLRITVRPPWWKTTWAVSLYILLAISAIVILLVYWQRILQRRYNEIMKKQEEEREKALYKQRIRFFIGLIHEIRTPLTLIRLQHDKDAHGKNDTITRNLDYMQETINKILTYDQNASGGIQMLKTRLDLREVVSAVTETFQESAASENITLSFIQDSQPVMVMADEDLVTKILTNLLSNALKYTKDHITVTVSAEKDNALVRVEDNGPGVRRDQREKIFGMFYTVPDDKVAESSGIGVGLAYARQLAQAHDGSLKAEDSGDTGASFALRIPLLKELLPVRKPRSVSAPKTEEKLAVLVVEDNKELRATLQKDLSQWYDVLAAPDGSAALKLIEEKGVDIVVSDVMMPVMDGFELCRAIKGQLAFSHIPVVLLTAKVTLDAKSEGMESGADAYVEKPFTIRQLKGQIDNLIKLREAFRQSVSSSPSAGTTVPSGPEADFIRAINDSIEKQISEESFSIETLAYDMAMSRTNFFRKFRALTGETPNDYLKNYRLEKAAEAIRNGARINEAAESVGFTSSSYFAKCFKARFGVLPKDYTR